MVDRKRFLILFLLCKSKFAHQIWASQASSWIL